jgi:hypothetical protein
MEPDVLLHSLLGATCVYVSVALSLVGGIFVSLFCLRQTDLKSEGE